MSDYILKENEDGSVITVEDVQEIIIQILVEFLNLVPYVCTSLFFLYLYLYIF